MAKTSKQNKEIKQLLKQITNKRARIVIEHILSHGFVTTEELEKKYGYNHPPRAARDVREFGIPLETFRVKHSSGRTIAAYRFGDMTQARMGRLHGRQTFPKQFNSKRLFMKTKTANVQFALEYLSRAIYKLIIACPMKLLVR